MISSVELTPLDQWRERFGGRRRRCQPRPLAALGYLTDGPVVDGLIEIEKLTLVLLYDDLIRPGQCALRLAGYCGHRVPWGVCFGGYGHCTFLKDLFLQPVPEGDGYRLDLTNEALLALGLSLDYELGRHVRFRRPVRDRPSLPKFWAGFSSEISASITGGGPELQAYAARMGLESACLLERLRREHNGMVILPLPWVSHHWQAIAAIFADLRHFPKRQIFHLRQRDDLAGFHEASEFNFLSRPGARRPRLWGRRRSPAAA